MKYFSTSTMKSYDSLDEAVAQSIVFNDEHHILSSEILAEPEATDTGREPFVKGTLNKYGSSKQ